MISAILNKNEFRLSMFYLISDMKPFLLIISILLLSIYCNSSYF